MTIRRVRPDEGVRLKEVAIAAKSHWGYERLWVEPPWMGRGLGTRLFRHTAAHARAAGAEQLQLEAEPNAVAFHERMAARVVRDSEPGAWGRILPVMELDLGD